MSELWIAPRRLLLSLVFGLGLFAATPSFAQLQNGNFSNHLDQWTAFNVTWLDTPAAQFNTPASALYQPLTGLSANTTYDLQFTLSNPVNSFTFAPVVVNGPFQVNSNQLVPGFSILALTPIPPTGGQPITGAGTFAYSFATPQSFTSITLFFVFAGNPLVPHSVDLSNVTITSAPGSIPGTGLLSYLALGLLGLGSYGWKRLRPAPA